MKPTKIYELIDQTGVEMLFGAAPVQLPKIDAESLQSLLAIDDDLVQSDVAF